MPFNSDNFFKFSKGAGMETIADEDLIKSKLFVKDNAKNLYDLSDEQAEHLFSLRNKTE